MSANCELSGATATELMQVALQSPRPTLVTNDRVLKRIEEVEVILLDDLANPHIASTTTKNTKGTKRSRRASGEGEGRSS